MDSIATVAAAAELRFRVQTLPEEVLDEVRDSIQEIPDRTERLGASLIMLSAMTVEADIPSEPLTTDEALRLSQIEIAEFRGAEDEIAAEESLYWLFDAIASGNVEKARCLREQLVESGHLREIGVNEAVFVAEVTESVV